ncbi:hypothetical protein HanPI659440_Chr02g0041501 [Helianthus annuus]|nr:hypothetical protein HanPI659440_Chr02g0041501 [Helianthus annuus]
MGARKDLSISFSRLTQEEVETFCMEWVIGLKFNPVAPGCDKSVDQCLSGSVALYCRHFEFFNLRHPFSTFVMNVLEYYRVSFGQIHPKGMARVLHFEVLCRASGYDPSLLLFRRFFCLVKNGNWFTFETTKVDTCLISSVAIRQCPSRVRPFPEHLLVLLGISKLWDKPDRDSVLMRSGQVMSALDFVKSDDTFDVVFTDAQAAEGDDALARGSKQRFEDAGYVSVSNAKGFTKAAAPKTLTRRFAHCLKSAAQSSSDLVELSDDIEVSESQGPDVEKGKNLVVVGKKKASGKKVVVTPVQGSSSKDVEGLTEDGVYVPGWSVKMLYRRWRVTICFQG